VVNLQASAVSLPPGQARLRRRWKWSPQMWLCKTPALHTAWRCLCHAVGALRSAPAQTLGSLLPQPPQHDCADTTKKMAPMTTPAHSSNEGSVSVSHFSTVGPWHTETTTHPPPEAGFAGREAH